MKIERVYLAGPMTGLPDLNYPAFDRAALFLRRHGYTVVSPAEHEELPDSRTYEEWLRWSLGLLLTCQSIALLPTWELSKGARAEKAVAEALNMRHIYLGRDMLGEFSILVRPVRQIALA